MLPVRAGSGTDAQLQRDGQLVRETGAPLMRESEAPHAILGKKSTGIRKLFHGTLANAIIFFIFSDVTGFRFTRLPSGRYTRSCDYM